ncbi:hypothetical protein MMC30_003627 [Trapelia coarctata]|nr:hypothetical protein [Trapelia coarctata]
MSESNHEYKYENGRRYHAFEETETDVQHHIWRLNLHNELYLSPLPTTISNVLEIGTGTGIWALEFAGKFPHAQVTGIDLSPYTPPSTPSSPVPLPSNVNFLVANAEEEWKFETKFDFIHARVLCMAIRDWARLFRQAFDNLQPGGWLECQEVSFPLASYLPEDTRETSPFINWTCRILEAMQKRGVDLKAAERFAEMLRAEGFVNIAVKKLPWPVGTWAEDGAVEGVGELVLEDTLSSREAVGYGIVMGQFGETREEVERELKAVAEDIRDPTKRYYGTSWVYCAQKPPVPNTAS